MTGSLIVLISMVALLVLAEKFPFWVGGAAFVVAIIFSMVWENPFPLAYRCIWCSVVAKTALEEGICNNCLKIGKKEARKRKEQRKKEKWMDLFLVFCVLVVIGIFLPCANGYFGMAAMLSDIAFSGIILIGGLIILSTIWSE
ncbi:MAG TPA: hypothetical protein VFM02_00550 [Candidatus Paceibacterota bacterium]|nr:hypothetical protein [Candidatus Paceibacterota bacterium]